MDLGDRVIKKFADGEVYVQIKESIRGCDVFRCFSGKSNHQAAETFQFLESVTDQAEGRATELVHQAWNQQCRSFLSEFFPESDGVKISEAVVMDRGDQTLLKIHAVFDATTLAEVMTHT